MTKQVLFDYHFHVVPSSRISFFILILSMALNVSALILNDLPTPSFIVDLDKLSKRVKIEVKDDTRIKKEQVVTPSIFLSQYSVTLFPMRIGLGIDEENCIDYDAPTFSLGYKNEENRPNLPNNSYYLHSSVIRSKKDTDKERDVPSFLAEIDLQPSLCGSESETENDPVATLCLGLNNHHVGGYYWARSAGSGSAMEAPGVRYGETDFYKDGSGDNKGILRWEKCNTNDGKRSEWVNFLAIGDTVQLIPRLAQDSILEFVKKYDFYGEGGKSLNIFGITMKNRPLGSEPEVICEWRCG